MQVFVLPVWFCVGFFLADAGHTVSPIRRSQLLLSSGDAGHPFLFAGRKPRVKISGHGVTVGRQDDGSDRPQEVRKISDSECGGDFPASYDLKVVCPPSCPFKVANTNDMCSYRCITEEQCLHDPLRPASVTDVARGLCEACSVPGCDRCEGHHECLSCGAGYDLIMKKCYPSSRTVWRCSYGVLGLIIVILLVYLICLKSRKEVNPTRLQQAINYRSWSKARDDQHDMTLFPVFTDLCNEFVSGVGVTLHFRFQRLIFMWSVFGLILTSAIGMYHHRINTANLGSPPLHEDAYMACRKIGEEEHAELESLREKFVIATGIIYVVSTLGALYFSYHQQWYYQEKERETTDMEDFALLAEGFPKDTGDKELEVEYTRFFKDALGAEDIVGVSICWDIGARFDEVIDVARADCSARDDKYDKDHPHSYAAISSRALPGDLAAAATAAATAPAPTDVEQPMEHTHTHTHTQTAAQAAAAPKSASTRSCLLDPQLRCIDGLLWGTPCMRDEDCLSPRCHEEKTKDMLNELTGTGSVFVVFKSEAVLEKALYSKRPLPQFRGEHSIHLQHLHCGASTVQWEGFSVSPRERRWRIAKGTGCVLLVIVIWAVCFYGPYAHYLLSYSRVAGQSQGNFWQNTLLGLLISLGNQIVYYACADVAARAQFRGMDNRMKFSVVLYTLAVFINTVIDMLMTIVMAFGYQNDMEAHSMIRNPSLQEALYVQLVGYLYPGTLLIPYFVEPVAMAIAPYFLGKWLIRSRTFVSREDAEACLMCPQFDLNRYGDHIINSMLVILLFFLTSVNLYFIFMMMTVSLVWVYGWDSYRFLRQCSETWLVTKRMDVCAQYLLALPCATLSAAFVFKWYGGQDMVLHWKKNTFFSGREVWTVGGIWFCVHLVLHVAFIKFVIPRLAPRLRERSDNKTDWSAVCGHYAANWFNSNPIHCLRSKHVYAHEPPFIFYQVGKEYLQKKNADIGAYYEVEKYGEDLGLGGELKYAARRGGGFVAKLAKSASSLVHRGPTAAENVGGSSSPEQGKSDEKPATKLTESL